MRTLTSSEMSGISGGNQHNLSEAIKAGGAFSAIGSVVAGFGEAAWYLTFHASPLTSFLSATGTVLPPLQITGFAAFGLGGLVGAVGGLGMYYADLITIPR